MFENVLQRSLEILAENVRVLLVRVAQLEDAVLQCVVEVAQLRSDLHQLWSVPSLDLAVASRKLRVDVAELG
jgi:hypothetical protein